MLWTVGLNHSTHVSSHVGGFRLRTGSSARQRAHYLRELPCCFKQHICLSGFCAGHRTNGVYRAWRWKMLLVPGSPVRQQNCPQTLQPGTSNLSTAGTWAGWDCCEGLPCVELPETPITSELHHQFLSPTNWDSPECFQPVPELPGRTAQTHITNCTTREGGSSQMHSQCRARCEDRENRRLTELDKHEVNSGNQWTKHVIARALSWQKCLSSILAYSCPLYFSTLTRVNR